MAIGPFRPLLERWWPNLTEAVCLWFSTGSDPETLQKNLIMPEPTIFLNRKFPIVSIIRPTETKGAAMGAVQGLTADGLFRGQSKQFFELLRDLAEDTDDAQREV